MPYNPNIHHRKSIRLKGYDYSQAGLYFVTICVNRRGNPTWLPFGDVVNGEMMLNDAGRMVEKWYHELENKFPDKKCHEMVVMPNHFHCIIENVVPVGADLRVCPDNANNKPLDASPLGEPSLGEPFLATKTKWQESDPKELCDWFEKQRKEKDKEGQMLRLVKYFKTWANQRSKKMPSGIAFSVWVATHYKSNTRDDIYFYETTKAIKNSFGWETASKNPATPGDDFLAKLDSNQKRNFKEAFNELIKQAEQALQQDNHTKALNIWKQQFGDKFPVL
jgi:hypothetical protein